jgi:hypothetical protein
MSKQFIITYTKPMSGRSYTTRPCTLEEAIKYFGYTLECGASYGWRKGYKKINCNPKTIKSLITNLNNASTNTAANGCGDFYEYTPA